MNNFTAIIPKVVAEIEFVEVAASSTKSPADRRHDHLTDHNWQLEP